MKKILVPTDFSDCARRAEAIALDIASRANAEIHYMHIIHTPLEWRDLPLEKENLYPETKAQIAQARSALAELTYNADKKGLISKSHLVYDRGREEVMAIVRQYGIELIVMGSYGADGFKELLGSNAQMMVRYAPVPVLVVKGDKTSFSHMVFASDFEAVPVSSGKVVSEFAELLKARITLLYVNTPYNFRETDEVMADMEAFKEATGLLKCDCDIYCALNAERGIEKYLSQTGADLVVLASVAKSNLLKLITSSLSENLVNHIQVPVLSIKEVV